MASVGWLRKCLRALIHDRSKVMWHTTQHPRKNQLVRGSSLLARDLVHEVGMAFSTGLSEVGTAPIRSLHTRPAAGAHGEQEYGRVATATLLTYCFKPDSLELAAYVERVDEIRPVPQQLLVDVSVGP